MKRDQKKQGVALSFLSTGIGALLSIAYTPFMLRTLGQSEYGVYNIAASIVSYLSMLNFGMNGAYVRFYIQRKVDNDHQGIARLNGMYTIVFSVIAVIAFVSGVVLAQFSDVIFGASLTAHELSQLKRLTYILAANLGIAFISNIFSAHIVANESFVYARVVNLISQVINPLVSVMLLVKGFASMGLAVAVLISTLASFSFHLYYCVKKLHIKFDFHQFDFRLFKEVFVFSFFIFLNTIVNEVNWQAGKTILGIYRGSLDAAIYGLAIQLNSLYISFSVAISNVFIPKVNKLVASGASKETVSAEFERVGRYQFILMFLICSGFVFFGKPFVRLWGGAEYSDAYFIAVMLMVSELIPLTQNLGIEIQRAMNKHRFRSVLYIVIALFNIAASIPLGRLYGGIGCAVGTAVGQIIGNTLIMNWYYQKVLIDVKAYWRSVLSLLPALFIPLVFGLVCFYWDISNILKFIIASAVYSVLYIFSIVLLGLRHDEKKMLQDSVQRLLSRA